MSHRWIAGLAAIVLLLGACAGPSTSASPANASPSLSPLPSQAPSPVASQLPSVVPSAPPSVGPTSAPEPTDALGPFTCALPVTLAGTASGEVQAQPTAVRVGTHPGYDRIVFEFGTSTSPALRIEAAKPPFTHDPSNLPMTVAGSSFVRIRLDGVQVGYTGKTDFAAAYPELVQLSEQGDFEAIQSWIAGLAKPGCVRVFTLSSPQRIVVDIESTP